MGLKIYTRTGDRGTTALFTGGRVGKDNPRVEAFGTVDEANACTGLAAAACVGALASLAVTLRRIQQELFDLGADLADPRAVPGSTVRPPHITATHVERLEADIDQLTVAVPPLRQFILPGGCEAAARLHLARTVVRRAERRTITAAADTAINPETIRYLNRLSDLYFIMARAANHSAGVADVVWQAAPPGGERS